MLKFIITACLILLYLHLYKEMEQNEIILLYDNITNIILHDGSEFNISIFSSNQEYTILFDSECKPIYDNTSTIDIEFEENGERMLHWKTIYMRKKIKITREYLYTTKINTSSLIIFKATNASLCKKIILYKQLTKY
jgi:hypothetical protein